MSSPDRRSGGVAVAPGSTRSTERRPLSRERIIEAALALLDREGLDALTMRRVAHELDTGPMSLYRHVASRDELLDLVLAAIAGRVPLTPLTGEWRDDAAALSRDTRAALLARRDLTLLLTARLGQGPAALSLLDRALGIFLGAGLPPRDAVRANQALGAYVSGACTWEAVGLGGAGDPAERAQRAAAAGAALAGVPGDLVHVAESAGELFAGTADDRFEYGLAVMLDGFAARLERLGRHGGPAGPGPSAHAGDPGGR